MSVMISKQAAIDAVHQEFDECLVWDESGKYIADEVEQVLDSIPSAELERDTSKRVLWTGWKGYRDTRYKCPKCEKFVRNDDVYCHRCGQKLMFPKISFTPYVHGETQQVIVRWDDE